MRLLKLFALKSITIILVSTSLCSCMQDENNSKDRYEIIQMTVASKMEKRVGKVGRFEDADCILVNEEGSKEWKRLSPFSILDFEYEEGFESILKVKKIYLNNPLQDASSIEYELIEILYQIKVEE